VVQGLLQIFRVVPMLLAVAILRTDRRLIGRLREGGATSPERAVGLGDLNPLGDWRLRRLASEGAVHTSGDGRYSFDEAGYAAYRSRRRRRAFVVLAVLLLAILAFYLIQEPR
jgi:hypothetical protein